MPKDYIEQRQTKTPKTAATRERQTAPYDHKPYSPAEIGKLYRRTQIAPGLAVDGGDGLQDKTHHNFEVKIQAPQDLNDPATNGRLSDYHNDCKGWVRAPNENATAYPCFDKGGSGLRYSTKPAPNAKLEATGRDTKKSPFSRAHKVY